MHSRILCILLTINNRLVNFLSEKIKLKKCTEKYWNNEANCARSTACGLLDYNELISESKILFESLSPMGGGVGEGEVCGVVIGTLEALSLILNRKEIDEETMKELFNKWKTDFNQHFNSILCRSLIKEYKNDLGEIIEELSEKRKEKCENMVFKGVFLAQEIINSI